jgi:shikimate O-hydroxycinnamoyltransferase
VTRVYAVSPKLLADVKSRCAPGVSTYCAVTAHLWRCVCVARGLAPGEDTLLGLPANVRHRLRPPLPRTFFGNAVVRDLVTAPVSTVLDSSLGSVAETIKKAVDRVDDAFARSVLDYLELQQQNNAGGGGGQQAQAQQAPSREQLVPATDLWAVSWLGMAMYDADFGSGAPRFVAPAQMFGVGTAYMTPRGPDRDDGIAVLISLESEYLPCFEKVFFYNE